MYIWPLNFLIDIIFQQLLCEHWEAIDKYYNNLLIERKAIDESIDSILWRSFMVY